MYDGMGTLRVFDGVLLLGRGVPSGDKVGGGGVVVVFSGADGFLYDWPQLEVLLLLNVLTAASVVASALTRALSVLTALRKLLLLANLGRRHHRRIGIALKRKQTYVLVLTTTTATTPGRRPATSFRLSLSLTDLLLASDNGSVDFSCNMSMSMCLTVPCSSLSVGIRKHCCCCSRKNCCCCVMCTIWPLPPATTTAFSGRLNVA